MTTVAPVRDRLEPVPYLLLREIISGRLRLDLQEDLSLGVRHGSPYEEIWDTIWSMWGGEET